MYIYTYIYIYTHTYTYTHTHIHIHVYNRQQRTHPAHCSSASISNPKHPIATCVFTVKTNTEKLSKWMPSAIVIYKKKKSWKNLLPTVLLLLPISEIIPGLAGILALREKCPTTKLFLVRIFLYADWIYPLYLRKASFAHVGFSRTWRKDLFIADQYN